MTTARSDGYARLRRRAFAARGLIAVYLAFLALLVLAGVMTLLEELQFHYTMPASLLTTLFVLGNMALAVAAIPVLLWVHRAHWNMRESGLRDLTYSPGWATASFLVPLANLVVPFRAMRELWNRSHGEDQYQAAGSVPQVNSWWSCFVFGNAIELALMVLRVIDLATPLAIITPPGVDTGLTLFAIMLLMGAAFFLWRIIGTITRAQASLADFAGIFA